ncbi:MAG TPA: YkgJ family cysteine cluster protein [Acidimicrobiales bacterium]|nr:YkgJ family cysteine cluster protein [Acidimicrobiales bacterium]
MRKLSLADVYARIPEIECKGLCQDSCGPIAMSNEEDARLRQQGVVIPPMLEAVAALERGDDYYCPALQDQRCTVYGDRPTICRLWGATESMPCPHGCTPADALSQQESHELLRLSAEVGGGLAGSFGEPDSPTPPSGEPDSPAPRSGEQDSPALPEA